MVTIGVISVQGDVSEHMLSVRRAMDKFGASGDVISVKKLGDIEDVDALIIPGGESTTISRIMKREGLTDWIKKRYEENKIPIMGTCAGSILLASSIDRGHIEGIRIMDIEVIRNAFGRQKESFEALIDVDGFDDPYHAVFIRAPIIKRVWGRSRAIAWFENKIVGAIQDKIIALTFHPELTDDLRFYEMFFDRF